MTSSEDFIRWFRLVAPYVRDHRHKLCVISLPEAVLAPAYFQDLVHDLALLHSLRLQLVVIFEGLASLQSPHAVNPAELQQHMHCVGERQYQLQSGLSMSLPHSPMQGAAVQVCIGNWITAKPYGIHNGIDHLHYGLVRKVGANAMRALLEQHNILLLPPLGYSPTGEVFALNHHQLAAAVAIQLQADKLITLTHPVPLTTTDGEILREVQPHALDELSLDPQTHALLSSAAQTCQQGVKRCHLIDYQIPGSLLRELFSRDGSGTLVTANPFETLRAARVKDIPEILALTRPFEEAGILIHRSAELLKQDIGRFVVVERDNSIIGCAALYPFIDDQMAEVACIAIHPDYQKAERGEELLNYLETQAKKLGCHTLFALTTQTYHWFIEQGFSKGSIDSLPALRRKTYDPARSSMILVKSLIN